ncbi:DNA polymerase epsilon catalytic subunit A [Wolffia australiana]
MGSLMAGWNCPMLDAETAKLERNKSLTKEEIESFWKVRRSSLDIEEDGEILQSPRSPLSPGGAERETGRRKASLPWGGTEKVEPTSPCSPTGDWWTRSNWAFLNEPASDEVPESAHKYAAQFHVARMTTGRAALDEMNRPHSAPTPRSRFL